MKVRYIFYPKGYGKPLKAFKLSNDIIFAVTPALRTHFVVVLLLSHVQLFATLWTVACQTPLSMGLPRQKYWSGLPFPSPRSLPNPGIEPRSPVLQADSSPSESPGKPKR